MRPDRGKLELCKFAQFSASASIETCNTLYNEGFSPGRGGARFEAAFRDALRQVAAGLITHGRVFEHFHRVMLRRYPYTLCYGFVGDQAAIVGVLYSQFDPKRIEGELARRTA